MSERKHHHALQTGYKLHWYEMKTVLGRGGFGITYLAQDTNLNRPVAIKEYLPVELALRDSTDSVKPLDEDYEEEYSWGLERFTREAQTLARFQHPNIVRVISVFEENNTGYMVMEYEAGQEFQMLLKGKQSLDEGILMGILMPLIEGLEIVHEAGFIHRDIKPQNILIRQDGSPLLIDFGSARQALGGKTKTLTSLVSPGYAPYEQYHSKSDKQGPWTDIYALAAVMYRCILGRPPMSAVDRSESIIEGTGDLMVPAKEIGGKSYTTAFLKAIDHGLQFKPTDRPQTLASWRKEFVKTKPMRRLVFDGKEGVFTSVTSGNTIPQAIRKPVRPVPRRSSFKAVATVMVVILMAGLTWWQHDKLLLFMRGELGTGKTQISQTEKNQLTQAEIQAVKINDLLANANDSSKANRLLHPEKDNAHYYFQQVLTLDPGNKDAKQGIDALIKTYFTQADTAIVNKKFDEASRLLGELKPIAADNKAYQAMVDKLDSEKEQHAINLAEIAKQEKAPFAIKLQQEKITQLLNAAKDDMNALRLTSPVGNNAFEKYQEILTLDPEHAEAHSGVLSIAARYIEMANQLAEKSSFERAYALLAAAETVTPGAENIKFAKDAIDIQKREAEASQIQVTNATDATAQAGNKTETTTAANSTEAGEANQVAADERRKLQEEIALLKQQTEELKQSTTKKQNIYSNIILRMEEMHRRFNGMGLDRQELLNEVKELLSKQGANVSIFGDDATGIDNVVMDLTFRPTIAAGDNFGKWSAGVIVNYNNNIIFERYAAKTGMHLNDLKPAKESYIQHVNEFISENKDKF